jgi:signal transduction histidine kinase
MTIRTRLTAWYAGILFIFTLIIAGLAYHELVVERKSHSKNKIEEDEGYGNAIEMFLCIGLPSAIIGIGGGSFLMRKALAPISALTVAASKIHDRNLHERLARSGNGDEIDRLTEVFNSMIGRLENSFQQIREFTLHASHELKTPLTIMSGELETALRDENLPESQREQVLSQIEEIQRLAKIVDGLTLLTKAGAGQLQFKDELLNLHDLVRDVFEDAQILAQSANITVSLDVCQEIIIHGDRHRIRQLLLNIMDNAIKYNCPDGKVTLRLCRNEDEQKLPVSEVIIANTGSGIAPELLPRVFEPFFRGNLSHDNAVDGCGLGLSICKIIVDAHKGTIALSSQPHLTTVTVKLPIR